MIRIRAEMGYEEGKRDRVTRYGERKESSSLSPPTPAMVSFPLQHLFDEKSLLVSYGNSTIIESYLFAHLDLSAHHLSDYACTLYPQHWVLSPCNSRDYIIQITSLSIVYYCYCTVSNP